MAEAIPLTRVFITTTALATGEIEAAWAEIDGDCCRIRDPEANRSLSGEGSNWHRTRWAAENYARQRQAELLTVLRSEIARVEGYRFGRPGT
ncbi:hypothetical protein [Methylobacterium sp. J-070]|uniref:hypothetical protein n=1 Tax=Methylobacterium sp. J-070 TaxID=2836650 RepID=UPI001FBA3748|nr:hypothetical protein [Methylobacterium sp. J-070]MCJ2051656.1 hypothetical protein [Methylobacterium sp. J-070]